MRFLAPAIIAGCTMATAPYLASAASDPWDTASRLGTLVGAENACELTIDRNQLARMIEERVPADHLDFASWLQKVSSTTRRELEGISETERVAFCTQVRRSAEAHGLLASGG